MQRITPPDLSSFLRRYRFPGGRVRGIRIAHTAQDGIAVDFRLSVREAIKDLGTEPQKVRLQLRLAGVEEYRFQMRPNLARVKIVEARIAHLNGLFYIAFDALALDPGERPQVHDFRASELFAAGRDLSWAEAEPGSENIAATTSRLKWPKRSTSVVGRACLVLGMAVNRMRCAFAARSVDVGG